MYFVFDMYYIKSSNIHSLNDSYLLLTVLSYTCLCPAPSSFLFSCLLSHVQILHHERAEKKNIQIMAEDEHQIHKMNVSFYSVRLITFFIQISHSLLAAPFHFSDEETETVISRNVLEVFVVKNHSKLYVGPKKAINLYFHIDSRINFILMFRKYPTHDFE